jgi:hypothetical protein
MHDKYHSLFSNRTPEDILDFLVNYFWAGKMEFVENYVKKRGRNENVPEAVHPPREAV